MEELFNIFCNIFGLKNLTHCLVAGCHLPGVSGFSYGFFLCAGVHLLWRVQTVKLMKMLQNQSGIFTLPRNLLGQDTSEIHVPKFV